MSPAKQPTPLRMQLALGLGSLGYRVFPLVPNTKEPATKNGFKNATSDVGQITRWCSANPEYNIGLATGMQDNGMWVGVVDVDAKHGGVLAWKQLTRDNGGAWQREMPIHRTPRSGYHIFGVADPALGLNSANGFPKGIDTRGDGGYVVVPDSVFIDQDTGEIGSYKMTTNHLWGTTPIVFPLWVIDLWRFRPEPEIRASMARHPSGGGETPQDWMKRHLDWDRELAEDGFTVEAVLGDETRFTRPGKTRGTSLSLHTDGDASVAVLWSDNCPSWMRLCGQPTRDGGNWSLNGFQYYAAKYHAGQVDEAMSHIRKEFMPAQTVSVRVDPPAETPPPLGLNLPPSFWLERPWLTHVRDAAWAMGSSPDGQLMALLSHLATSIPPSAFIPAIVRDQATFDLLTVIVGPSGSGKSSLLRRAHRIAPSSRTDLRFGLGLSSGEGLLEAFYGMRPVVQDDGKVKTERTRAFAGVNVTLDEGALLTSLAGRQGFTGVDYLLTAWSGGTLSTPNAAADRFRHIEAGTYRFTATLGIQVDLAEGLWAGTRTAQGFTGRLLFGRAQGGDVPPPGERPADPGPLDVVTLPSVDRAFTYPLDVWREVQINDHAKQSPGYVDEPLDAHRDLLRLKVAGIFASVEGRFEVDVDDWRLASDVVECSRNVRSWLQAQARQRRADGDSAADAYRGQRNAAVKSAERDAVVARVARNLLKKINRGGVPEAILRQKLPSRDRKHYDDAIEQLSTGGLIRVEDGQVFA